MATTHGTVDGFKHTLIEKGLARPNLFFVDISRTNKPMTSLKLGMACHAAQIPGINIATTDKDIGLRSVAYNQIYSDIILSFYCDADMHMYRFWEYWCKDIINPVNRRNQYYENYVHPVTIIQLNRQKNKVAQWELQDAYPKQVDPVSLDYSSSGNVMSVNVTLTYRKAVSTYFDSLSGFEHDEKSVEFGNVINQLEIMNQLIGKTGEAVAKNFASSVWTAIEKMESVLFQKEKSQVGGAGGSIYNQSAPTGV